MDQASYPIDLSLEPSGDDDFDRARALMRDGREAEALDWFELSADAAADPAVRNSAALHVTSLLLGRGRPHEAKAWTARLASQGAAPGAVDLLDAAAHAQLGEYEAMLTVLESSTRQWHDPWFECREVQFELLRAHALYCLERTDEAEAIVVAVFERAPELPDVWPALAKLCAQTSFDPGPVVARVALDDTTGYVRIMAWLRDAEPAGVDRIAETMWARAPQHPALLAAALRFADQVDLDRSIEWSIRLLESGSTEPLPVLRMAQDPTRAAADRIRAAAVAATFAEADARAALEDAAATLEDDAVVAVMIDVLDVAPELADSMVVATASSTTRCLLVASCLTARHHEEEALAVLVFGLSMDEAEQLATEDFDRLVPKPVRSVLADTARGVGDLEVADLLDAVTASAA